jgi:hypothetical protein
MNTIRDSIPVETLLRQYIDESTEYEVRQVEPKPQPKPEPKPEPIMEVIPVEIPESKANISFNDQTETFEIPVEEETLKIGEDIQLNAMSFEDLENSSCEIDLGIVEL